MAKLLRLHFASVGHRDARLAPLTLDLRSSAGQGTDSVVWLRNGGGKSSILNLFFSLLRPERREFLGATAEARARRLEDYVKASDLGFVISEWDLAPADSPGSLFDKGPGHLWILGQILAWKAGQRSSDASRLRRIFFSLRERADVRFETLPVHGLGNEPVTSVEAFRDYLHRLHTSHPELEVVTEEAVRRWSAHLERLRVDPELFQYQIKMNQREGAADELFRFRSARDFVHFLLELALPPGQADRVAENLAELRDQLRRRPALVLEQGFLGSLQARLGPLAQAVASLHDLSRAYAQVREEAAANSAGLLAASKELTQAADVERAKALEAERQARESHNEQRTLGRWAEGLERHARVLELATAKSTLDARLHDDAHAAERLAVARAAVSLQEKMQCTAEVEALREALGVQETELAPLRQQIGQVGAALFAALERDIAAVVAASAQQEQELLLIVERLRRLESDQGTEREQIGATRANIGKLEELLQQRERARDQLRDCGILQRREEAQAAKDRWDRTQVSLASREQAIEQAAAEAQTTLDTLADERKEIEIAQAELNVNLQSCTATLEEAMQERDRIETHALVLEAEEVDRADLFAAGLAAKLSQRAEATSKTLLGLRVEGLEDERALTSVAASGLLPPSPDVERVVECLRQAGVVAHAAYAYLAENVAHKDERERLLCADPATHSGVVVMDTPDLEAARGVLGGCHAGRESPSTGQPLMGPVSVSVLGPEQLQCASASKQTEQSLVLAPTRTGLYDHDDAAEEQGQAQVRAAERERLQESLSAKQRSLVGLAHDLDSFLRRFGAGQLEALQETREARLAELELNARRQSEVAQALTSQRERLCRLGKERRTVTEGLLQAGKALERLSHFIDVHEQHHHGTRKALDDERCKLEQAQRRSEARAQTLTATQHHRDKARDLLKRLRIDADTLRAEQAHVSERVQEPTTTEVLPLAEARARYDSLRRRVDERLGNNRLQGQLDERERQQQRLLEAYRQAVEGLVEEAVTATLDQHGAALAQHVDRCAAEREATRGAAARAEAQVELAQQRVVESSHRREADDLPTDEPTPTTAEACRSRALELRAKAEGADRERQRATQAQAHHETQSIASERRAEMRRQQQQLLEATTGALLESAPAPLPEDDEEVLGLVASLRRLFETTSRDVHEAQGRARGLAEKVRDLAHDERFLSHKSQIRERLKAPPEELMESAADYTERIAERQRVLEENLEGIDRDREMLITAVMGLCDNACRLLERAGRASRLPASLTGWAGRQFLQVGFRPPTSEEAKRDRLTPLIDRLVEQSRLPGGLELAQLAVDHVAGPHGFDVKVLKPDAVLRTDALPIVAMTNFSRGQQLTAAVLLYCTLARLRAIHRGRSDRQPEGGVLILDNPIGTCSSVALLELQRQVARAMDIQLVYTTGVHDLEALSTLPNIVRLRNTHRERRSGDHHVTAEDPGPPSGGDHRIEGVRIGLISEDDAA